MDENELGLKKFTSIGLKKPKSTTSLGNLDFSLSCKAPNMRFSQHKRGIGLYNSLRGVKWCKNIEISMVES